jgi:pyruvate/2-oxoglutarate dehydrogenase complex dihydrolipoamide acyltransferase (E2) component
MSEQQNEVNATPAAVEAADAQGVDLAEVDGSGADGKVVKADVEAAAEEAQANVDAETPQASEEQLAAEAPQAEIESADADKDPSGGDLPEHAKSPLTGDDVIYPGGKVVNSAEHAANQILNVHPENGLVKDENGNLVPNDEVQEERGQSGSVEQGNQA